MFSRKSVNALSETQPTRVSALIDRPTTEWAQEDSKAYI